MTIYKRYCIVLFAFLSTFTIKAQNTPVGYWSSLLPYNTAKGVATDGTTVYTITNQAFFTVNIVQKNVTAYSKIDGMSDIGMQCIAYDKTTSTAVLVYSNGNIDLFHDNTFFNIPDYKLKTLAGNKTVYSVFAEDGKAYLSTAQGILVLDLEQQNIYENYQFYSGSNLLQVYHFISLGADDYAITNAGLYKAPSNSPELQNFQAWHKIDSTHNFNCMARLNGSVYLSDLKHVYKLVNDTAQRVFNSGDTIVNFSTGINKLFVSEFHPYIGALRILDTTFNVIDTVTYYDYSNQVVELDDSSTWTANSYNGLARLMGKNQLSLYTATGPGDALSYDIYANNGSIYVAHGGFDDKFKPLNNTNGFSFYKDGKWTILREGSQNPFYPFSDSMHDFVSIAYDEASKTIYSGSYIGGLFEYHPQDYSYKIYKQGVFDLSLDYSGDKYYQVYGTGFDQNGNLWVTLYSAKNLLYVREKATGNWYKMAPKYSQYAGPLAFDNANDVWYICPGGGVRGYNANGTFGNTSDDVTTSLYSGVGAGNLPNTNTISIACDKNDNLWIGTTDGIGILYNASQCLSQQNTQQCDAEIPIVQYDQYAGYLFKGENVRTIAVDGANRKWVGTDNGVWLLSPDAGNSKIIYHFTADNSPLPTNLIEKIAVDKVTGDVYIGTAAGLMCYRSTATDGGTSNSNVMTFPNPVPSNYHGTIAIRGLVANADVRITDINGQLVYKTTALGGQAVWNGLDYKGHKPQSGVYLIFSANADGSETYAGKMVFMN